MADVVRELTHDDDEQPVMILRKKSHPSGTFKLIQSGIKSLAIPLRQLEFYSEEHNPDFKEYMFDATMFMCEFFDLGRPTSQKMSMLANLIQGGFDELVNLPPPLQKVKIVGEVEYQIKALHGEEADIQGVMPIREMNPVKED